MCLGFLSITIVWSEVTFSIDPPNHDIHLSFFAFLVYAGHKFQNYITVEVRERGGEGRGVKMLLRKSG